jgi:Phage terminase large subunit (GpA)
MPGCGSTRRPAGAPPGPRHDSRAQRSRSRGGTRTRRCCSRSRRPTPAASGAGCGSGRSARRSPKGELYRWLKLEWPTEEALDAGANHPPGACHFPQYGEEYFKQLTAERLVTRIVKGFPRGSWEKEPGRRNEALDCRVYARAAAAIYGLDRFEERHWRRMEEALARTVGQDEPALPRVRVVRAPARQVIHSNYMAR